MTTHPTAAAGAGLPAFTLPPLPANADAYQLWALHAAVQTLTDVADGLLCQPRFDRSDGMLLNAAGEALSDFQEALCRYSTALYQQVKALPAGDGSRDDFRARLIIEYEAQCFDGMELFKTGVGLSERAAS